MKRKRSFDSASCLASLTVLALLGVPAGTLAEEENQEELAAYTLEAVGEHANRQSCWVVIEGRVYDVTAFIPNHPTPPGVLLEWCGKEATEGWRTKGYGNTHSADAEALLAEHLIGVLED